MHGNLIIEAALLHSGRLQVDLNRLGRHHCSDEAAVLKSASAPVLNELEHESASVVRNYSCESKRYSDQTRFWKWWRIVTQPQRINENSIVSVDVWRVALKVEDTNKALACGIQEHKQQTCQCTMMLILITFIYFRIKIT